MKKMFLMVLIALFSLAYSQDIDVGDSLDTAIEELVKSGYSRVEKGERNGLCLYKYKKVDGIGEFDKPRTFDIILIVENNKIKIISKRSNWAYHYSEYFKAVESYLKLGYELIDYDPSYKKFMWERNGGVLVVLWDYDVDNEVSYFQEILCDEDGLKGLGLYD